MGERGERGAEHEIREAARADGKDTHVIGHPDGQLAPIRPTVLAKGRGSARWDAQHIDHGALRERRKETREVQTEIMRGTSAPDAPATPYRYKHSRTATTAAADRERGARRVDNWRRGPAIASLRADPAKNMGRRKTNKNRVKMDDLTLSTRMAVATAGVSWPPSAMVGAHARADDGN